jgi:hypothetical protein
MEFAELIHRHELVELGARRDHMYLASGKRPAGQYEHKSSSNQEGCLPSNSDSEPGWRLETRSHTDEACNQAKVNDDDAEHGPIVSHVT